MPPDDEDAARLWDMLIHAKEIADTVQRLPFEAYTRDKTLRMATERRIEIIGEAARNVSQPFQEAHPEIPWRRIIATRHIFAHEYGELKQEIVFRIATKHVTDLIEQLSPLIPSLPPEMPES
jgi:uncharacterized protein with HEPN domain